MKNIRTSRFHAVALCAFVLSACAGRPPGTQPSTTPTDTPTSRPTLGTTTSTPSLTPTPQPRLAPVAYGPDLDDFSSGVNPLTGLAVEDSATLELPAVLVSISNMPVTARPQAGPGFAPWIFEIFIGEGTTRFMAVFYGDYPRIIPNLTGDCPLRADIPHFTGAWVGNRVWLDENANGQQDSWEAGVGGVCIGLYAASGQLLASTSTDSNGYYAFEIEAGRRYFVEFDASESFAFTTPNVGDDDRDSDADPATGRTSIFEMDAGGSFYDAGLLLLEQPIPTPSPVVTGTPPGWFIPSIPYVGPIRSGRLTYNHIYDMFPGSCLIYASAGRGIREALHGCEIIYGADTSDPNSALLTVEHMRELAGASKIEGRPVNYSGNLFSDLPPAGGQPAESIRVFYHSYSQSKWEYDPLSGAYLRFTDLADGTSTFVPATERLTGRQQTFENVIVILADYQRVRHLQYDINLGLGLTGFAWLFRDGQVYPLRWSTLSRAWEQQTGLRRPLHFTDAAGNPFPLKPGRTWIHTLTLNSFIEDEGQGRWKVNFIQPYDPEDTPEPEP